MRGFSDESQYRLGRLRAALAGDTVAHSGTQRHGLHKHPGRCRAGCHPDGRPFDANIPIRFDKVHVGEPARIVDGLLADEDLAEATELTLTRPAPGGIDAHLRTLDLVAEHIAPALGWTPLGQ